MPAVVCRRISRKSDTSPYSLPGNEWLAWHDLTSVQIAVAKDLIERGIHPPPGVAAAGWTADADEAQVFLNLEIADAVARLLRKEVGCTLVYAAIRAKPMAVQAPQCVIEELPARPAPVLRRKSRRPHSSDDWHQRAANSGGND